MFEPLRSVICSTVRGEQAALLVEDVRVFGEEAEDQPGEEMVEILPAGFGVPLGVFLQQFDVELVQPAGGADVEGVFVDPLDGGDARQREEEPEAVGKLVEIAGERLAVVEAFGLDRLAVGGEDEPGLVLGGGGACRSASMAAATSPGGQVSRWMLFLFR